jgi:hypothetical protein
LLFKKDALPAFRDFVTTEKQRLTRKRQALVKSEMDKRMAELVKFSQSFKVYSLRNSSSYLSLIQYSSTNPSLMTLSPFLPKMKTSSAPSKKKPRKTRNLSLHVPSGLQQQPQLQEV